MVLSPQAFACFLCESANFSIAVHITPDGHAYKGKKKKKYGWSETNEQDKGGDDKPQYSVSHNMFSTLQCCFCIVFDLREGSLLGGLLRVLA